MSDFDSSDYVYGGAKGVDDFERLDNTNSGHSIHEQPDLEDRENLATAAASKLAHDDDDEFPRNAGGFSSTDRPLVTPPSPQPIHHQAAETIGEIRLTPDLTPDPEEKAQEPFVNVTAGGHVGGFQEEEDEDEDEVRDLGRHQPPPPAWEATTLQQHTEPPTSAYHFETDDLDPTEGHFRREEHFSAPSAPEPSLFDPVPSHHQLLDELDDNFEDYSRPSHHETAVYDEPTPAKKTPSPTPPADLLNLGDFVTSSTTTSHVTVESSVQQRSTNSEFYETEVEPPPPAKSQSPPSQSIPEFVPEPQRLETISQHQPFVAVCPAKMEDSEGVGECTFHPRAWFNPSKLDPRVADLMYWRDLKRSGIAFGSGLVVLLSLTYFSLISVVAYVLLAVMTGTLSYRIYKNVLQAVQKSNDGHPFKEYLDVDLALPSEKVREGAEIFVKHLECTASRLRRLFLVEDIVDSIKFAVVLWVFTYIGAWFNGLTLFILGFISLFTLPKVYETYKTQIDLYLNLVFGQVSEVFNKIKAKLPIGKKPKQQ